MQTEDRVEDYAAKFRTFSREAAFREGYEEDLDALVADTRRASPAECPALAERLVSMAERCEHPDCVSPGEMDAQACLRQAGVLRRAAHMLS
jgi:hypothetical protein